MRIRTFTKHFRTVQQANQQAVLLKVTKYYLYFIINPHSSLVGSFTNTFIGLDKQNFLGLNCKYFLTYNFSICSGCSKDPDPHIWKQGLKSET